MICIAEHYITRSHITLQHIITLPVKIVKDTKFGKIKNRKEFTENTSRLKWVWFLTVIYHVHYKSVHEVNERWSECL